MKIINTKFKGLKIIKGINHNDKRGYFREIYKKKFIKRKNFIFWCISKSKKNVIRGLHLQRKIKQDLHVSVLKGKIYDIAVDLRKNSKTYSKYSCNILSEKNSTSLVVPAGFAHGFCALENENVVLYGISNYRSKKDEVGILWNDSSLNIKWPLKKPLVSKKDKSNITLKEFKKFYL